MEFKDEEKIRLFDKIEELYFRRNFGSVSKSDLETLLFSEYIECCIRNNIEYDDYSLSKALGITQARVRTLKERKELKYPLHEDPDWWKEPFVNAIKNAKYDEKTHSIKFIIQDVNVMSEIRHFIETAGWYDECSLNRKLLTLPLDCFTDICLQDQSLYLSEEDRKEIAKLATKHTEIANFASDLTRDGFKSFLMSASRETIGIVLQSLPFGGIAKTAFDFLSQVIVNA